MLVVRYTNVLGGKHPEAPKQDEVIGAGDPGAPAWRVGVETELGEHFLSVPFGRKEDAERAAAAFKAQGIETKEQFWEIGFRKAVEIAIESLAW